MLNRYQICSVWAILSMGFLSASDLSVEAQAQAEIAFQNPKKQTKESPQKCSDSNKPRMLFLQPCPDAWRFSADFLYFMPTVDDTYFVINSPIVGDFTLLGTRSNNNFGFNPGFRVGAEYAFCQTRRDIQVFYSYLHAEQTRTISGDNMWATVGSASFSTPFSDYVGTSSAKLKLLYQRLDFNISQHIIDAHGFNLYVQPGFEYAYLRLQQNYGYNAEDLFPGTVYQQSREWGIGPQLGMGFDSNLYQGSLNAKCSIAHAIAVSGLFSSSLLTGQGRTWELDIREGDVTNDLRDKLAWRVIPAMHARVGLAYLVHGSSMGASLDVGYEFNTYIRGLAKAIYSSSPSKSNAVTNYYNFDIQGLDISIAFTF
jgi:hypothetical protein